MKTVAYRYVDSVSGGSGIMNPDIDCVEYEVACSDQSGFCIKVGDKYRFVDLSAEKQYAHLSKHDALSAYIRRTTKAIERARADADAKERRIHTALAAGLREEMK